jgi:type I restriction enzyme M protein
MTDALRNSMDVAESEHVVLRLVSLKYVSDAFEAKRQQCEAEPHADPEDPDEYCSEGIFLVPPRHAGHTSRLRRKQPTIGEATDVIERNNLVLKG